MGDSQVYEALRKKAGKPAVPEWPEVFKNGRPEHVVAARCLLERLKRLDPDPANDVHLRRKVIEAVRTAWGHRLGVKVLEEYEVRALKAEAGLTNLLPLFRTPPAALLAARDWFQARQKWPRAPRGHPLMPYLDKILADLGLPRDEGCLLLRAAGIGLPTGRRSRR